MTQSQQPSLFSEEVDVTSTAPVDCLGHTFPDTETRRKHFDELLREKLSEGDIQGIEGFPQGLIDTILSLSDPPFYTACPNPFISQLIEECGTVYDPELDDYHREPFAADVSEGKNDPIYMAHSYHTKVPPKAIVRYLMHYTRPGDVVLDGFSGSGMTGVAATLCQNPDPKLKADIEREMPDAEWGPRLAILNDLSPAASFISYNYNTCVNPEEFSADAEEMIEEVRNSCGNWYQVQQDESQSKIEGFISYTVWSAVFRCPHCSEEFVFYDHAVDAEASPISVRSTFPCPHCKASLTKRNAEASKETYADPLLNETLERIKRVPVLIRYLVGKKQHVKRPDDTDFAILKAINLSQSQIACPVVELPAGSLSQGNRNAGMTHLHHYYTPRNFLTLAHMLERAKGDYWRQLFFLMQAISVRLCSYLTTYQLGKRGNVPMTGTLYVASLLAEANPIKSCEGKLRDLLGVYRQLNQNHVVSCGSSSDLRTVADNSIDYVFIDPPFGDNLNYAQLNSLWEGWLGLFTRTTSEAIVDRGSQRDLRFYQEMLRKCLCEFYRVLKPNRWLTVAFHNSKNAVWNAIQEAIQEAGFLIADVRTLDKKQGTPKQVNSSNAVKQDLVISAYKPLTEFERQFELKAGTEEGVWDFLQTHLEHLPVFVSHDGKAEALAERQNYLLFDRMVAFHIQRGCTVPMSASQFYAGLRQRFPERDGMYFLSEQVSRYEQQRSNVDTVEQMELFVTDEKSAIRWVRSQLAKKSMTYQSLQPLYMKEAQRIWMDHEQPMELRTLLEENFVLDDGKDNAKLKDHWRVPDPSKEEDLEQLRHRALLKEFTRYQESKGKLRKVRSEAIRAGFKDCWQRKEYRRIVELADRLPDSIIQEDSTLLMYYDNALMRTDQSD